jgi:hypothetical protein
LTSAVELVLLDEDAGWLEAAALLELLELPPHALASSETPTSATRTFIDAYICAPIFSATAIPDLLLFKTAPGPLSFPNRSRPSAARKLPVPGRTGAGARPSCRVRRGYDVIMAGRGQARRGSAAAVLGSLALLGVGCATRRSSSQGHESASTTATKTRLATRASPRALRAQYLVIARAGNLRLNADFDPLEKRDRNDLARAKADLADAAATERSFDRRLLRISFPSQIELVAHDLYRVNEARARLTSAAAESTSLRQLHAYEPRLDAANRPVEQAVTTIRQQLGLPPPPTS